jgi:hypothetical protein
MVSVRRTGILAIMAAAFLLLGCSRSSAIPAGAQVVHVAITQSGVQLQPSTVRSGDVYLVLDAPPEGSLAFISRGGSSVLSPLTDADLVRLSHGDTESMAVGGLDAGGCSPAQNAEDRGRMGPCGNVLRVDLSAGQYAVMGATPDGTPGSSQLPLAVLEVAG